MVELMLHMMSGLFSTGSVAFDRIVRYSLLFNKDDISFGDK